jgi:hypothetical protein
MVLEFEGLGFVQNYDLQRAQGATYRCRGVFDHR